MDAGREIRLRQLKSRLIDTALSKLHYHACLLKVHHNQLGVVGLLPSEMWCLIFFEYIRDCFDSSTGRLAESWLGFSHVCHRWREIAVGDPSLWRFISSNNPGCVAAQLERSGSRRLDITIALEYGISPIMTVLPSVFLELHRIQRLSLTSVSVHAMRKIVDNLPRDCPVMESLELKVMDDLDVCWLPKQLFCGETSRLRSLLLQNCALQWDSHLLSGLTSLSINFPAFDSTEVSCTVSGLLRQLHAMPELELLRLEYCLDGGNTYIGEPIYLPNLEVLEIRDEVVNIVPFIKNLRLPTTTRISILCITDVTTSYDVVCLCRALNQCNGGYAGNSLRTVYVCSDTGVSGLRVVGYNKVIPWAADGTSSDNSLLLDLFWGDWTRAEIAQLVSDLLRSFRLDGLASMKLLGAGDLSRVSWVSALKDAVNLEMIHVRGSSFDGFVKSLRTTKLRTPEKEGTIDLDYLPSLQHVVAEQVHFEEDDDMFGTLVEVLQLRQKRGMQLQCISLRCCSGVQSGDIWSLQGVVKEVKWDGVEGWESDSDANPIDIDGSNFAGWGYYCSSEASSTDSDGNLYF